MEDWIQVATAGGTLLGAFAAAYAAFTSRSAAVATRDAAQATRDQLRAQTMLACLNQYIDIRRQRLSAEESDNRLRCENHYRELFDLHWSEFQLYRMGVIPEPILRVWLDARKRNYENDSIIVSTGDPVTYKEVWKKLVDQGYWPPNYDFRKFMEIAHEGDLDAAMRYANNRS